MKKLAILLLLICLAYVQVKANPPVSNTAFDNVIKTYLEVKNALVTDNAAAAKTAAANMLTALSASPDKDMDAAQRKAWLSYAEKLTFDTRHISESDDIDHQREHFSVLSGNMLAVLKALQLNTVTLYKQYCPMKKKYWVSETLAIKNPYYGSKMVTCGDTKETLQAVK